MRKALLLTTIIFLSANIIAAQDSYADLIVRIKPSVVKISVYDDGNKLIATGSGFFISQTKIVTNKHVISDAKRIQIKMFDGSVLYAKGIQAVRSLDIAILEVDTKDKIIKPLTMAASLPREGDKIIAFGSPLGLDGSISDGIVAAIRNIGNKKYLQITAPISPGSSGSPVFDLNGRVVGVATLNLEGGQNLNFAIPVQEFTEFWMDQPTDDIPPPPNSQSSTKRTTIDLTGNWKALPSDGFIYRIVDTGSKVSISMVYGRQGEYSMNFDGKWVNDIIIAYYNPDEGRVGYNYKGFYIFKALDSGRMGMWYSDMNPAKPEEKINQEFTKKSQKKPEQVLIRYR